MRKIDMHIHTCASDGCYTPEEAVGEALNAGISVMAVADHDSVESVLPAMKAAAAENIRVVAAMEATTLYRGREIHLLGYGFSPENVDISAHVEAYKSIEKKRQADLIGALVPLMNGRISMAEYAEYTYDRRRGGFSGVNYLKDKGAISSLKEFSALKRTVRLPDYDYKTTAQAIEMFKKAGAFTVLAHPSYHYRGDVMDAETLDAFRDMGVDGIECISPYNGEPWQSEYYSAYCRRHSLAISGGSDCHGPYLTRLIGTPEATDENTDILTYLGI